MNLDDRLRAAAAAIQHNVDPALPFNTDIGLIFHRQQLQRDYEQLEADYQRRLGSPAELRRLDDEIAGLELEEASYRLARQYEQQGRFLEAAHWFLKAAQVDHADAAARLASVLDQLGDHEGAAYWLAIADDGSALAGDAGPGEPRHEGRVLFMRNWPAIDCAIVQARNDEYLNHELPAAELAAIRRHLLTCQECLETYAARLTATGERPRGSGESAAGASALPGTAVKENAAAQRPAAGGATAVLLTEEKPAETASTGPTDQPRSGTDRWIVGAERRTLARDLVQRYTQGESIRAIAASTGRSYGFVHRVLTESGVQLRQRGGARRRKKA